MKVKIYGKQPFFKTPKPMMVWQETAEILVKQGRAEYEPPALPWTVPEVVKAEVTPQKVKKVETEQEAKETKVSEPKKAKKQSKP